MSSTARRRTSPGDPHPTRHIDHSSEPVMVQPSPDTKWCNHPLTPPTALSSAKCTSGRSGARGRHGPRTPLGHRGARRGRRPAHDHPSRSPRRRRLSKSVAKAPIEPGRRKRIVDIPRFFSRPIRSRGAFATDLDKPPPEAVPRAPHAPPRPAEPVQRAAAIPPVHYRGHSPGSAGRRGPESTSSLATAFPLLSTASSSTDCRPLLSRSGRATGRPVV